VFAASEEGKEVCVSPWAFLSFLYCSESFFFQWRSTSLCEWESNLCVYVAANPTASRTGV
jgi:hypothetical protein